MEDGGAYHFIALISDFHFVREFGNIYYMTTFISITLKHEVIIKQLSELFLGITPPPCFRFVKNKGGGGIPNVENHQNFPACGRLFGRFDLIFERFSAF